MYITSKTLSYKVSLFPVSPQCALTGMAQATQQSFRVSNPFPCLSAVAEKTRRERQDWKSRGHLKPPEAKGMSPSGEEPGPCIDMG